MENIHYDFHSELELNELTVERVWDILINIEAWPQWASGFKKVQALETYTSVCPGLELICEVRGNLPYSLFFHLTVTRVNPPYQLEFSSKGDLVGSGRWDLTSLNPGVRVSYDWNVDTTGFWANLFGRFRLIRNLMIKNHDQVMEEAQQNLRNQALVPD